jgi:hypothetical protein
MRTITVSKWSVPVTGAAIVSLAAIGFAMQPAQAADTMVVHVKASTLVEPSTVCPDGILGAHFIINQLSNGPASIDVVASGITITVPKDAQLNTTAHYTTTAITGKVTDATAVVPTSWTGQFVLSNYVCSPSTTTTTSSSSSTTSTSSGTPTT